MKAEEFRKELDEGKNDSPLWRALRGLRDVPAAVVRKVFEERGDGREDDEEPNE